MERIGEPDRILERELGARADREMRGVRGIAEQHDVAVIPALAGDAREVEPRRAAQVRRVADQTLAVEMPREQHLARGDAVRLLIWSKPSARQVASPHSTMNVEVSAIEAIGVRPDPAVLGLFEDEGERLE